MEVEGNTAASVQDASFLKKDAVVDEKSNNVVETTATGADKIETIKKSEADCSSTVAEKDDLLEQIEEVCKEKLLNQNNSEDISKTSEHEFLKKIDEIENNGNQVSVGNLKEKSDAEKCKVNNLECETSAIDDVIVGDKVLVLQDHDAIKECDQLPSATSSVDVKESPAIAIEKAEEKCETTTNPEVLTKDTTVSSSTTKIEIDLTTDESDEDITEPTIAQVESTVNHNITVEERPIEPMESKVIDLEDAVEEEMEVDNVAGEVNSETMEVDIKDSVSENNVEMLSDNVEPKLKMDTIEENIVAEEPNAIDMKEVAATETGKEEKSGVKPLKDETDDKPEVVVVNHNDEEKPDQTTKPENKPLLDLKLKENIVSSSLTNTPVSSSNVFNSTPIQKEFEISSENVSKISDVAELSHTEKEEATSTKPLTKSSDDSTTESGTCATSETDHPSSDGTMKKYINAIKKYNGMPDTTTDEEDRSTPAALQNVTEKFDLKIGNLAGTDLKKDSTYEVNVSCEIDDIRYLSIERVDLSNNKNNSQADKTSASESSVQSSSNGSVTSLPPYSLLPQTVETSTSASTSSSTNCHSLTSQNKHMIVGIEELCNFMIHQFTKIKHAINPDSAKAAAATREDAMSTPTQQIKKNKKNSPSIETPSTSGSKTKRARKRSLQEDDLEGTPKAKQAKRDISKETLKGNDTPDSEEAGPCVLAKWVDKKFYAGKITAEKPGNKYVVLFEDGASKTLPKESIVFGESDILPLQDQQVYALVVEDYEIGTVLSIEKTNNKVVYTVKTETTTVNVTASDIYLEVDQAKEIQKIQNIKIGDSCVEEEETSGTRPSRNKRPPASPSTPEAGYSGAVGKRGGKRQKRYS